MYDGRGRVKRRHSPWQQATSAVVHARGRTTAAPRAGISVQRIIFPEHLSQLSDQETPPWWQASGEALLISPARRPARQGPALANGHAPMVAYNRHSKLHFSLWHLAPLGRHNRSLPPWTMASLIRLAVAGRSFLAGRGQIG